MTEAQPQPLTRDARWARLAHCTTIDLAVIGGGATGLGVALDAALRGFSVALFDSHDFASGTSSRSTKLLHGGVRYLAQGNVALVREALAERATVMHIAPHLAQPLPFVMPSHAWWQTPFYGAGLKLYDLMAGRAGLGKTDWLNARQTLDALPGLNPDGLHGGVRYWDGQFDDARLAIALARSAESAGAHVFNYAEVLGIESRPSGTRLAVRDWLTGVDHQLTSRCVVNATGVWVDGVRRLAALGETPPARMVTPSQGVHLVVDRDFMPGEHALLIPKTRDGRVLFAVPWLGKLILGTTDTPRDDLPREPQAFDEELAFIMGEASRVLSRRVRREDVRSVWVGLRPLVAAQDRGDAGTKSLSREHTIVVDPGGLVTVTGGKWTTYRAMAEDVLKRCFAAGLLPQRSGGRTAAHRLDGSPVTAAGGATVPLHAAPGLHLFGTHEAAIRQRPGARRDLGMGLTEAMVRHMIECEYAHTVEDVLSRRWRALFLDAAQAAAMAPAVARVLLACGVADPGLDRFVALCQRYRVSADVA